MKNAKTDYTDADTVVSLLEATTTDEAWNRICDLVLDANSGSYPDWWFERVIKTNLAFRRWVET